ncbi:HCL488Wp [Eremothecium sinecaudum]|uniref:Spindle pole body component SPC42 n=1 Tax=Eremothecium sinecaudum TaxID=45286 RepID=A0A109UY37_9SACH|nr:HCL488Wp [Eremothecium sinecaudum]AMD19663.1 HCL488Wp [Eremothecium sinecaudum]
MNISPTPKRYQGSNNMPRAVNLNYHNPPAPSYHPLPGHGVEQIVPEEYKINSNMISSLIKQNKDLLAKLDEKDRELEKLNVLVGSLRGKLIKYTELNKKLQGQLAQSASVNSVPEQVPVLGVNQQQQQQQQQSQQAQQAQQREVASDFIQLPRRTPGNSEDDKKINEIYNKLETLTNLLAQQQKAEQDHQPMPATLTSPKSVYSPVTEDDIMISESSELKKLEEQVDHLKRKVLIKSENELRKLSLNQQLVDLMEKLTATGSPQNIHSPNSLLYDRNSSSSTSTESNSGGHPATHCEHCHHPPEETLKRPTMDIKKALETPTPSRTRRDISSQAKNSMSSNGTNAIW